MFLKSHHFFKYLFFTSLMGMPWVARAQAERIKLVIDEPTFKPYPIAVATFKEAAPGELKAAQDLTVMMRGDIGFSPAFVLVEPKSYLESDVVTAPKFDAWLNVGASGLVTAEVKRAPGNDVSVSFYFFDIAQKKMTFGKTYTRSRSSLVAIAHEFADDLTQFLTGEEGLFSTRLAFSVKGKSGPSTIYVADFDGRNAMNVTPNGVINMLPAWDRQGGGRLFFTSYIKNNPDLYALDLGSKQPRVISAFQGINSGAALSPDGSKLALTLSRDGNSEIYVMNVDGSGLKRLTDNWWIDTSPTFSPDGSQIAYVSNKSGNPHIYVMNADGSGQRRVTFQGSYNQTPEWSPKGDEIAFTGRDERFRFDIFTLNLKTQAVKRLTQDQGNNEEPSWSPDGRNLVFTSTRMGGKRIFMMRSSDGSKQQLLFTGPGDCESPAWSPRRKKSN